MDRARAEQLIVAPFSDASALPGRGVQATVDGQRLALGSTRLLDELGLEAGSWADDAQRFQAQGRTVSWLVRQDVRPAQLLGLFAFGDTIKAGARAAVERLSARGVRSVLITGDNQGSACTVARALGIDDVRHDVLPADKAGIVAALRAAGERVAMVGDGINDAPALAAADVGMAMARGTDVAMQTAGITLMRGDPRLVADAIDISRRTYATIRRGLFWAFAAAMGASLMNIFLVYTGESIVRVFFITSGTFAAMSLWGYTTRSDLSRMGSFMAMGLIGIVLAGLVNMFIGSSALQFAISIIGVVVFTGLTAFDTQRIKSSYLQSAYMGGMMGGQKQSVYDALTLYLNFINLFMLLLQLTGDRRSN